MKTVTKKEGGVVRPDQAHEIEGGEFIANDELTAIIYRLRDNYSKTNDDAVLEEMGEIFAEHLLKSKEVYDEESKSK